MAKTKRKVKTLDRKQVVGKKALPETKAIKPTVKAEQIFFTHPTKTLDRKGEFAKTLDGFENFTARLGLQQKGNTLSDGFYSFNLITRNRVQLEACYRGSWIGRKLIDIPADDMTRAGITVTSNDAAEKIPKLELAMKRLRIWQSLANTIRWGALYGGALGILQIKGQKLETPLDPETVSKDQFLGIAVYDRWQLNPDLTRLIQTGPDIGLPEFYYIVTNSTSQSGYVDTETLNADPAWLGGQILVHHSRCVRMGGDPLPFWQAITEMLWDESVLETLWDRLISFDTATMSAANLINRAQLRTVQVDGLREILAAGGPAQDALLQMFEMVRQFQVNEGLTLLDKEDLFSSTSYSFAGVSDVMLQFAQQLSGATDIPLIRLFSQSPTGMNATGDTDLRLYYDGINSQQEAKLRNPVWIIIQVLWRSLFGEAVPSDLEFVFSSLWQTTPKDKADISKSNTETILGTFEAGLTGKATALKELRQSSGDTGLFSNITDEDIADAEEEDENPPMPEIDPSGEVKPDKPGSPIPSLGKDSIWKRIMRGKKKK